MQKKKKSSFVSYHAWATTTSHKHTYIHAYHCPSSAATGFAKQDASGLDIKTAVDSELEETTEMLKWCLNYGMKVWKNQMTKRYPIKTQSILVWGLGTFKT